MLEFFITSTEFNFNKSNIIEKIRELYIKLEKRKQKRAVFIYRRFWNYKKCSTTKLPAVKRKASNEFYSLESLSKIKTYENNEEKFKNMQ